MEENSKSLNTCDYRVIDPETKQVSISRDVVILEDEAWNREVKCEDSASILVSFHTKTCQVEENST